jgi:hypothetical protein
VRLIRLALWCQGLTGRNRFKGKRNVSNFRDLGLKRFDLFTDGGQKSGQQLGVIVNARFVELGHPRSHGLNQADPLCAAEETERPGDAKTGRDRRPTTAPRVDADGADGALHGELDDPASPSSRVATATRARGPANGWTSTHPGIVTGWPRRAPASISAAT